ncbi:MAG: PHB depolymerase family esterase [Anaerolineales bacterium]
MAESKSNPKRKLIWAVVLGLIIFVIILLSFQFRTNGQITSGGRTRKYLVYVPESYDPAIPAPLVISIHGFVQWPAHQQFMSGWNKLADEHGFLVVYPQGTGFPLRWNTRPTEDDPESMGEDLEFFSDLIEHFSRSYNIDHRRIYANGMSNGGGMSHLLACELSEHIAAFGGVAGAYAYPWENCNPPRPVPVIAFHGMDDPIVPYLGETTSRNDQDDFLPVEDWAGKWAEHNACTNIPQITKVTSGISQISYLCDEGDGEVILYRIEGGGHTWPGGEKLPVWIAGYTNQEINASALMWEFFSKHSLNPE